MHTTLAFLTLQKNVNKGAKIGDYKLITPTEASKEEYKIMKDWLVARVIMLIFEHDVDLMKGAHKVKTDEELVDCLLAYATTVLNRFDTILDQTSRVLGGGITNRWNGRLKIVKDFLVSVEKYENLSLISKKVLEKANTEFSEMCTSVQSLVDDSRRFIEAD